MPKIGFLGNSITQGYYDEEGKGWPVRLNELIAKKYPCQYGICNMAYSGDRIPDTFHRLGAEAFTRDISILFIADGTNDLSRSGDKNAPTSLSEDLSMEYWQKIFDTLDGKKIKVIVMDLLPVCEDRLPGVGRYNSSIHYFNKDIEKYNKMLEKLCHDRGYYFLKNYATWKNKKDLNAYFHDFGHPNAKGHQEIADRAFKTLEKLKWL